MSEFIGSRISLVSKSDIRYVGILHEINSETSTVALEQVQSYGTEGRRSSADEEVPPSDSIYDYIVFRGSDVKDLRIEEPPKENKPPQVPNDPAILGSGARPPTQNQPGPNSTQQGQDQPPHPLPFQQQPPPFPYYYPPPGQRFGQHGGPPGGFPPGPPGPPGPGFPGLPYGPPQGWYPGFPQGPPGPFPPHNGPGGPPGQQPIPQAQNSQPINGKVVSPNQEQQVPAQRSVAARSSSKTATPNPATTAPPPPMETKPDVTTALAPAPTETLQKTAGKPAPLGPKKASVIPAVPLASPKPRGASAAAPPLQSNAGNVAPSGASQPSQAAANAAIQSATQAATAAVAAAMAKLPPAPGQKPQRSDPSVDNLTKKVNEMRANDSVRTSRQPGTGGYAAGNRGGRGSFRGTQQPRTKVEVPAADFDFESANAKFNKQDLIKEAIATGSPAGTPSESGAPNGIHEPAENSGADEDVSIPPPASYNKASSFFDNISSELTDREKAEGKRPGGKVWRGEEQKKNMETFGQGSVDHGYRGGFRGRGRGRGFGRGRGGPFRGTRGSSRGRGGSAVGDGAVST